MSDEVIEYTAPGCGIDGCTADVEWITRYPGDEGPTARIRPLGPFTITCPVHDRQISTWTEPPPSAPRYVHALRAIAERTAS